MNRYCGISFARLAVFGALAAALTLTGCGRKGPLDPPPVAGAAPAPQASRNVGINPMARPERPQQASGFDAEGRPIASRGAKRPLPMDWLID